jgi:hypothetical protein
MPVFLDLTEGEATAINDACMIVHIDNSDIVPAHKSRDRSQIGLVAGCKDESSFLPKEPGQLRFQFFVDIKIPI